MFVFFISDLVQASTHYRKAAGVYDYLSREILARLNRFEDKPAESTMRVSSAMSLLCLAEAQVSVIHVSFFATFDQNLYICRLFFDS